MSQLFLKKTILEVASNQDDPPLYWIPTPFWTPALYAHHTQNLQKIKGFRQQKDWFRHSDDNLSIWLSELKIYLLAYPGININVDQWCFWTLLEDPGFCWHLLFNCLAAFYKHRMHISIIECINIMVDAFLIYKSGCDEYDRDSEDNSIWQYRILCCDEPTIPFAALCMYMNEPSEYHFMTDKFKNVLIRRMRSCYRQTGQPGVFSSLIFDSNGIPKYHESSGISLVRLIRPDGRFGYPIESMFQTNSKYKKFGEVFKNMNSSNPFMIPEYFFKRAFHYLGCRNPRHNLVVLQTILRKQCNDVTFTQDELLSIIMKFLEAFPNSKSVVYFAGFLFQTFLRSREKSLRLKSQFCRPLKTQLQMGCNQIQFDTLFVKRIRIIGFLEVMFSKSDWTSNQDSYSIMKRVLSGLLL